MKRAATGAATLLAVLAGLAAVALPRDARA
jgi:hypothetical protein